MVKEQIIKLAEIVVAENSALAQGQFRALENLIDKAIAYVASVTRMESQVELLKFRLEGEDYRAEVQRLDRSRRLIHDSFISCLNIVNRICADREFPLLYTGSDDRYEKGDFAYLIVGEFSGSRLREALLLQK